MLECNAMKLTVYYMCSRENHVYLCDRDNTDATTNANYLRTIRQTIIYIRSKNLIFISLHSVRAVFR